VNYYSEFDPHAAAWLRELIAKGLIPDGKVDERDIREVQAKDLEGFTQCHFFAGIGGWSCALRLAGWPNTVPVWTGSCPCQPFSAAGKRKGTADERHVWPEFFRLIAESRPAIVFGEQVASKDGLGWLDGVFADLEGADYACGAADLCAAGVGAPHIRQRLYWVADAGCSNGQRDAGRLLEAKAGIGRTGQLDGDLPNRPQHGGPTGDGMANAERSERRPHIEHGQQASGRIEDASGPGSGGHACRLADTDGRQSSDGGIQRGGQLGCELEDGGAGIGMEHATDDGRGERRAESRRRGIVGGCGVGWLGDTSGDGPQGNVEAGPETGPVIRAGAWDAFDLIPCRDGKARRVESGTFPLAHGIPGRVGLLRGYGNAIVPACAAEFIRAYIETMTS
jgi:DNA (cytosine-5)-methyltransferase 1